MSSLSSAEPCGRVVAFSQRPSEPLVAAATSASFLSVSQELAIEPVVTAHASARQTSLASSNGITNILEELRELDQRLQGVPDTLTQQIDPSSFSGAGEFASSVEMSFFLYN